jgi:4'-phosphopantetheinyl transferase
MCQQAIEVFDWPSDASKLGLKQGTLVIALRTSPTISRAEARQLVRVAIQEVLALLLHCDASEIDLISQAGQAIKLLNAHQNIGISVSHEVGLSLVAINMQGSVGIDLITIDSVPDELELRILAVEYLGADVAEHIFSQKEGGYKKTFSMAWTAFEASMKIKEEALIEWSAERDGKLKNIHIYRLVLPDSYIGSIAYDTKF